MTAPTAATRLPEPKHVRDLLTDLVGRDVGVKVGTPVTPAPATPASVAVFTSDQLRTRAIAVTDLALGAYLGGALGLLPPGGVQDAVADRDLSPMHNENLYEVVNVLSALFNVPGAPHLRLYTVHHALEPLPADLGALAVILGRRLDLAVSVAGYGDGGMSIVLAP